MIRSSGGAAAGLLDTRAWLQRGVLRRACAAMLATALVVSTLGAIPTVLDGSGRGATADAPASAADAADAPYLLGGAPSPYADLPDALRADSPLGHYTAWIAPGVVRVQPHGAGAPVDLRLTAVGAPGALVPIPAAVGRLAVSGTTAVVERGDVTEWFNNGPGGLEHGYTVATAPPGDTLELALALSPSVTPVVVDDGAGLRLRRVGSDLGSIDYGGLAVYDALGSRLVATFAVTDGSARILVDVTGARFPITVDPTFTLDHELVPDVSSAGMRMGAAVAGSRDGTVIAVGAPSDDREDIDEGAVHIYVRPAAGGPLVLDEILTAADSDPGALPGGGAHLGTSVAVSEDGRYVAAGAPDALMRFPAGSVLSGAVVVFDRQLDTVQVLGGAPTSPAGGDRFGQSVGIAGGRLVVGAPGRSNGTGDAWSYRATGPAAAPWQPEGELLPFPGSPNPNDSFGASVSLTGAGPGNTTDTVVVAVGEPGYDAGGSDTNKGRVHTYFLGAPGSGLASVGAIDGQKPQGDYGAAVAVAPLPGGGYGMAVGAPGTVGTLTGTEGTIDVYRHPEPPFTAWQRRFDLKLPGGTPGTRANNGFGASLALSPRGSLAVAFAPTQGAGRAATFAIDIAAGTSSVDEVVDAPSMGSVPSIAVLGATSGAPDAGVAVTGFPAGLPNEHSSGFAEVAATDGAGSWGDPELLVPAPDAAQHQLGWSVAGGEGIAVVGAPRDDAFDGVERGAAYFDIDGAGGITRAAPAVNPGTKGGRFGEAVAVSGQLVAIGAPTEDNRIVQTGSPGQLVGDKGVVHLYRVNPDHSWTVIGSVEAPGGGRPSAHFGASLAFESELLVVGAPGGGATEGQAFVYRIPQVTAGGALNAPLLTVTDPTCADLGAGVATDGQHIAVTGARCAGGSAHPAVALVRDVSGLASAGSHAIVPAEQIVLNGSGTAPAVALATDAASGEVLVAVGNPANQEAFVFAHTASGTFREDGRVTRPAGSRFGAAIDTDGTTLVVGSPEEEQAFAYAVSRNEGAFQLAPAVPFAAGPDGAGSDHGQSVAVRGLQLLIGAPNATDATGDRGESSGVVSVFIGEPDPPPEPLDPQLDVSLAATPTATESGLSRVPISALPPELLSASAANGGSSANDGDDISSTKLRALDPNAPLTGDIAASGLRDIKLRALKLRALGPLEDLLRGVMLVDIPISAPAGGWGELLGSGDGRHYDATEIAGLSLYDALADDRVADLTIGSVELGSTKLRALTVVGLALGSTKLRAIKLRALDQATTEQENLQDWCQVIADAGYSCAADLGIDPDDPDDPEGQEMTLAAVTLAGIKLRALDVLGIKLRALDFADGSFVDLPLSSFNVAASKLRALKLRALKLRALADANPDDPDDPAAAKLRALDIAGFDLANVTASAIPSGQPVEAAGPGGGPARTYGSLTLSEADLDLDSPEAIKLRALKLRALKLRALKLRALAEADPGGPVEIKLRALKLRALGDLVPLSGGYLDDVFVDGTTDPDSSLAAIKLRALDLDSPTAIKLRALKLRALKLRALDGADDVLGDLLVSDVDFSALPFSAVAAGDVTLDTTDGPVPVLQLSLDGDIDIAASKLRALKLRALPNAGAVVDCSVIACASEDKTLGDADRGLAILDGATLGDLGAALNDITWGGLASGITVALPSEVEAAVDAALGDLVLRDLSEDQLGDLTLDDLPFDDDHLLDVTLGQLVDALTGLDLGDIKELLGPGAAALVQQSFEAWLASVPGERSLWDLVDFGELTIGDIIGLPGGGAFTLDELRAGLGDLRLDTIAAVFGIDPLGAVLLSGLTVGELVDTGDMTLLDLAGANLQLSLRELLALLLTEQGDAGADLTLGDALVAITQPQTYAWEQLDLTEAQLQALDLGGRAPVTYSGSILASDLPAGSHPTLRIALPSGATYKEGSFSFGSGDPVATVSEGPTGIVVDLGERAGIVATPYSFEVYPPVRPGLGTTTVTVSVLEADLLEHASAEVAVADSFEPNDVPSQATVAQDGVLHISSLPSGDPQDLYKLTVTGGSLSVSLANLSADLDLVLYGPPSAASTSAPVEVEDGLDPDPSDERAGEAVLADSPDQLVPVGRKQVASSRNRGTADEQIDTRLLTTPGEYLVQVASPTGEPTTDPYVLRVHQLAPRSVACAATPPPTFATGGNPAALDTIDPATRVVFLVNETRMRGLYGPDADALLARLEHFVDTELPAAGGPPAAIVPVDAWGEVRQAYAELDADACNPDRSNAVVDLVAARLDALRAQAPAIAHVQLVGHDGVLPMAREHDGTEIANEVAYAGTFADDNDALFGAFASASVLTDDHYGARSPIELSDGTTLQIADDAVGRLVETPAEITRVFDDYLAADGLLAPDTAVVTGYDFLTDGADAQVAELQELVGPSGDVVTSVGSDPEDNLVGERWTGFELGEALGGAGTGESPDLASVNAHYDHQNLLPAAGNFSEVEDALFGVADLDAAIAAGDIELEDAIWFTVGCHGGLNAPDTMVDADVARDWPQSVAANGGIYIGNTGFGYGDTDAVAYSEQLFALFTRHLRTSATAGEAFALAKQDYFAGLAKVGQYDLKVLREATFYGLTFYEVHGAEVPPRPTEPVLTTVGGVTAATLLVRPTFVAEQDPERGTYYGVEAVEGDPLVQATPFQPIVPRAAADVGLGQPGAPTALRARAHGAIATGLVTRTLADVDEVVSLPTPDRSLPEPPFLDEAFPSGSPFSLRDHEAAYGEEQQLNVLVGRAQQPHELVLFDEVGVQVLYAGTDATDFVPPTSTDLVITRVGGSVAIRLTAQDLDGGEGVDADPSTLVAGGLALVADGPVDDDGRLHWRRVDLSRSNDVLVGGAPDIFGALEAPVIVQVWDTAGNVLWISDRGRFVTAASTAGQVVGDDALIEVVTDPGDDGWHDGDVGLHLVGTTYTLDDGAPQPVPADGDITLSGDGLRTIVVHDEDGSTASVVVPIDTTPPDPSISAPADGQRVARGAEVRLAVGCADAVSGATCATVVVGTDGAPDEPIVAGDPVPTDVAGPVQLRSTATDAAGNQRSVESTYIVTDLAISFDGPAGTGGWYLGPVTATITPTPADEPTEVSVDGGGFAASTGPTAIDAEGTHTVTARVLSSGQTASREVRIDRTDPVPTITAPANGSSYDRAMSGPIPLGFGCTDTNLAGCTALLDSVAPVAPGDDLSAAGNGSHTITVTATDAAGRTAVATSTFTLFDATLTVSGDQGQDGWFTGPVTVSASGYPAGAALEQRIDGAAGFSPSSGQVVVTGDGYHTVEARILGGAGYRQVIFRIDATAPDVALTSPAADAVVDFGSSDPVPLVYSCSDATSGVASCRAFIDGGTTSVSSGTDLNPMLAAGDHTVVVVGVDGAGNPTTITRSFKKVGASFSFTGAAGDGGWYRGPVTVEVMANPPGQALEVSVDNGAYGPYAGPITVSADGSGHVVRARVPGQTTVFTSSPFAIDATVPAISIGNPPNGASYPYGAAVLVDFGCTDPTSGVRSCVGKVDGVVVDNGTDLGTNAGSHTLVVEGIDRAGNTTTAQRTFTVTLPPPPVLGNLTVSGFRSFPLVTSQVAASFTSSPANGPHRIVVAWGDNTTSTCTAATSTAACQVAEPGTSGSGSIYAYHQYSTTALGRTITVTLFDRFGRVTSKSSTRLL